MLYMGYVVACIGVVEWVKPCSSEACAFGHACLLLSREMESNLKVLLG